MNRDLRQLALALALLLCSCDDTPIRSVGSVILWREGTAETSYVHKIGGSCWVAWYKGIEKVVLRRDGYAYDSPLKYRWTLNVAGPDDRAADVHWFDANCNEPPVSEQP